MRGTPVKTAKYYYCPLVFVDGHCPIWASHMNQHSVGADGSAVSIVNDASTDVMLLSDQQPRASPTGAEGNRRGGAFLGLSGSIASTDGKLLADGMLIILEASLNQ